MSISRKNEAKKQFDGSNALFNYCWRKLLRIEKENGIVEDVNNYLDTLAAEEVNDSSSRFYIYG
jgi:hypothetical protein